MAPGQVTDGSEMMMCLMQAYVDSNKDVQEGQEKQFDFNCVGEQYANWYNSAPFEIGQATDTTIKPLCLEGAKVESAIKNAINFNKKNKSNGSLLRCMPHAVFAANLEKHKKYIELKNLVVVESSFVHTNAIV